MITDEQFYKATRKYQEDERLNPLTDHGCVYTDENGCHCIAGQILSDLGRDIPAYGEEWNDEPLYNLPPFFLRRLTVDQKDWLELAQGKADEEHSWADAIAYADNHSSIFEGRE